MRFRTHISDVRLFHSKSSFSSFPPLLLGNKDAHVRRDYTVALGAGEAMRDSYERGEGVLYHCGARVEGRSAGLVVRLSSFHVYVADGDRNVKVVSLASYDLLGSIDVGRTACSASSG